MNEQGKRVFGYFPPCDFLRSKLEAWGVDWHRYLHGHHQDGKPDGDLDGKFNVDGPPISNMTSRFLVMVSTTLKSSLAFSDDTKLEQTATFTNVPPHKELTEAQKLISPYGVNYHLFDPRFLDAFKKAGVLLVPLLCVHA